MFKKQLVPGTGGDLIPVTFKVILRVEGDEEGTLTQEAILTHWFRRPSPAARESMVDALLQSSRQGRSRKALRAIWEFWSQCIVRVEGYEPDIPETTVWQDGSWKAYFRDEIGMEHVQAAVNQLTTQIGAEEAELVKK